MSHLILWIALGIIGIFVILGCILFWYKWNVTKRFLINSKNWSGRNIIEHYLNDDNQIARYDIAVRKFNDLRPIKKSDEKIIVLPDRYTHNNKDLYSFVKSCELAYNAKRAQPTFLNLWVILLAILSFFTFILLLVLIIIEYKNKGIISSISIFNITQLASISFSWVIFVFASAFFLVRYNYKNVEKSIINYAKLHLTFDEVRIVEQICEVRSLLWGFKVIFLNIYYIILILLKHNKVIYPKVDFENVVRSSSN